MLECEIMIIKITKENIIVMFCEGYFKNTHRSNENSWVNFTKLAMLSQEKKMELV